MSDDFKIVIPARYGATRLPGKPLRDLAGKPMIQHVVERARASAASDVLVATDDARIVAVCVGLGVAAMRTSAAHRTGTDRVAEVIARCGWHDDTIVVNLQGDEPCMPATLIDQVAANLAARERLGMATLAYPIRDSEQLFDPHVVKVVIDAAGYALYFSRAPLPWHRDAFSIKPAVLPSATRWLRHIGLYAYRAAFLKRFVAWPPAPPEQAESLEQLRALWHGERIHVGIAVAEPGRGVDTLDDLEQVARQLREY